MGADDDGEDDGGTDDDGADSNVVVSDGLGVGVGAFGNSVGGSGDDRPFMSDVYVLGVRDVLSLEGHPRAIFHVFQIDFTKCASGLVSQNVLARSLSLSNISLYICTSMSTSISVPESVPESIHGSVPASDSVSLAVSPVIPISELVQFAPVQRHRCLW